MNKELNHKLYKEKYKNIPESHIRQFVDQHFNNLSKENEKRIGLKYSNQHLSKKDIEEVKEICRSIESDFKGIDMTGKATASFFDPSWVEIYLNSQIVSAILIGVSSNAIFQLILTIFKKINGKTITFFREKIE